VPVPVAVPDGAPRGRYTGGVRRTLLALVAVAVAACASRAPADAGVVVDDGPPHVDDGLPDAGITDAGSPCARAVAALDAFVAAHGDCAVDDDCTVLALPEGQAENCPPTALHHSAVADEHREQTAALRALVADTCLFADCGDDVSCDCDVPAPSGARCDDGTCAAIPFESGCWPQCGYDAGTPDAGSPCVAAITALEAFVDTHAACEVDDDCALYALPEGEAIGCPPTALHDYAVADEFLDDADVLRAAADDACDVDDCLQIACGCDVPPPIGVRCSDEGRCAAVLWEEPFDAGYDAGSPCANAVHDLETFAAVHGSCDDDDDCALYALDTDRARNCPIAALHHTVVAAAFGDEAIALRARVDANCSREVDCSDVDCFCDVYPPIGAVCADDGRCVAVPYDGPWFVDAGSPPDAGSYDAGDVDAGHVDAGHVDAGHVDAGSVDAGHVDAGATDDGGG
jgi:hypothetical protein